MFNEETLGNVEAGSQTDTSGTLCSSGGARGGGEPLFHQQLRHVARTPDWIGSWGSLSCFGFDVFLGPLVGSRGGVVGHNYPSEGRTSHSKGVVLPRGVGGGRGGAGTQGRPGEAQTVCLTFKIKHEGSFKRP